MRRQLTLVVLLGAVLIMGAALGLVLLGGRPTDPPHPSNAPPAETYQARPAPSESRRDARPAAEAPRMIQVANDATEDAPTAAVLRGRVVTAHGETVPRALVVLKGSGEALRTVRTDPEGRFRLPLPPNATDIAVQHPSGWATESLGGGRDSEAVVIALRPGRSITGIVHTAEGVPVPLAPIVWWVGDTLNGATQADIHGHFSISGLPPAEPTRLAVASDHGSIEESTVLVPPGVTSATLTVPVPAAQPDDAPPPR